MLVRNEAMPFVASKKAHEWFSEQDKSGLVLEVSTNPRNTTGYVNVKKVKGGKYQAQLHKSKKDCDDGGQKPLPGLFDTALEAAQYRALVMLILVPQGFEVETEPRKERAPAGLPAVQKKEAAAKRAAEKAEREERRVAARTQRAAAKGARVAVPSPVPVTLPVAVATPCGRADAMLPVAVAIPMCVNDQ